MGPPVPVHDARAERSAPERRGLKRKNSKLQTHVEVLRCRLGKPTAVSDAEKTFGRPTKEWTPIHYAVYHQREAALAHFLQSGASPDDVHGTGQPPLCIAVANVDATTRDAGETALHLAIRNKQTDMIDLLLQAGPELEARTTKTNETPLHYAAASTSRSLAMMASLLKRGAKYDSENSKGQTPAEAALVANEIPGAVAIIHAARGRRHIVVKEKEMLLKHDARDPSSWHWNALAQPSYKHSQGTMSLSTSGMQPVYLSCRPHSKDAWRDTYMDGKTLLHRAVSQGLGYANVAQLLLAAGVDIRAQDGHGNTALHLAASHSKACVQVLLKHGANPNDTNRHGLSPLLHTIAQATKEKEPDLEALINVSDLPQDD
ncbi:hypothetical protein ACEQ8H_008304 [Pleosporales sp. CAS-2024a]